MLKRVVLAALGVATAWGVSGCADDYGYGRTSYGFAGGYGGAYGYGDGFYPSAFGWYGDYYYPGTGVYVYDRYRRPYRWNGDQQRYWQGRRAYGYGRGRQAYGGGRYRGNWGGFDRTPSPARSAFIQQRRAERQALNAGIIDRDQFRTQRQQARQTYRQEQRGTGRGGGGGRRSGRR